MIHAGDKVFLSDHERDEARRLIEELKRVEGASSSVDGQVGLPAVSSEFARALARILSRVADGATVTVGVVPEELTTSAAAEQLGVSRGTLMRLINDGALPSHKVGSHTRVKTADVVALRRQRLARQRAALEELIALEDELGIE